jgi:hypothetical protein
MFVYMAGAGELVVEVVGKEQVLPPEEEQVDVAV